MSRSTMSPLLQRMATRCILALTILVTLVAGIFAIINVQIQERQLLDEIITGADQLSRSIVSSTWHLMLADRRDDAYQVMQTIGQKQGIENIRFFNKEGHVTFSTVPGAAGQVDKRAEACFLCHAEKEPLVHIDASSRARIYRAPDTGRKVAMMTPIYNEPACSGAACHAHPEERSILGVLDISMDLDHLDDQIAGIRTRALLMTLTSIVLIGVFFAVFIRFAFDHPIRKLIAGTKAVSAMHLEEPIEIRTGGELAELAASFNLMRERLRAALAEINEFTSSLEQKVEERSRQLTEARQGLIRSDRMASLGQLAASMAHEINNPVSTVLNLSMLMTRILTTDGIPPDRVEDFRKYLTLVADETSRVGRIVTNLLAFSRRSMPQSANADVNAIVKRTITLITHKLELAEIKLDLELGEDLPEVYCDSSQIQQVLINLVLNAAEATPCGGRLRVQTRLERAQDSVFLEVEDTGLGIPEENLSKIFDPFFSTKQGEKGVGLGLAVVYGIVEAHEGHIDVRSRVGEGTTFTLRLPIHPMAEKRLAQSQDNSRPELED